MGRRRINRKFRGKGKIQSRSQLVAVLLKVRRGLQRSPINRVIEASRAERSARLGFSRSSLLQRSLRRAKRFAGRRVKKSTVGRAVGRASRKFGKTRTGRAAKGAGKVAGALTKAWVTRKRKFGPSGFSPSGLKALQNKQTRRYTIGGIGRSGARRHGRIGGGFRRRY